MEKIKLFLLLISKIKLSMKINMLEKNKAYIRLHILTF